MKQNIKHKQRALITVVGKDGVKIVAEVAQLLVTNNVSVLEINQSTMAGFFYMIILADLEKSNLTIGELSDKLKKLGEKIGQEITVQDEKIIQAMHRI